MQRTHYEVAIDGARHDAFVHVSSAFVERVLAPLFGAQVPPVVVLRIHALTQNNDDNSNNSSSSTRPDGDTAVVYAGCLAQRPQRTQPYKLHFSPALAADLRLRAGDLVECAALLRVPRATRVCVAPLTVDESEVVEANATRIEAQLLRQVQVVYASMPVTVTVFAGVQARVRVERVECGSGSNGSGSGSGSGSGGVLERGPALMAEGTLFVIATRARRSAATNKDGGDAAASTGPPLPWALLRALPASDAASGGEAAVVRVRAALAVKLSWRDGVAVDALDVARLARHDGDDAAGGSDADAATTTTRAIAAAASSITPAFLRAHMRRVRVRVVADDDDADDDNNSAVAATCVWPLLRQPTNVLLQLCSSPSPPHDADARIDTTTAAAAVSPLALPFARDRRDDDDGASTDVAPSLSQLASVHGDVVDALLQRLRFVFASGACACGNGNVLVCGGVGGGKTTLVAGVLRELCASSSSSATAAAVHVVWLTCVAGGKGFVADLHRAVAECVWCAPSVLVLDDLHVIAPAQGDGAVPAMSASTRAMVAAVLGGLARGPCVCDAGAACACAACAPAVAVVATCTSRDDVHADFRTAACFATCLTMGALTHATRVALLRQLLPSSSSSAAALPLRVVRQLAARMDNYTPFDVCRVVARALRAVAAAASGGDNGDDDAARLRRAVEACVSSFCPLAHAGIRFLGGGGKKAGGGDGGDAVAEWDAVGGLGEAKKVLYDTLVLPMRHRALFARLPLKTRSGILLYGPSGCGKTFVVEALVRAHGLHCIVVNGPEVFGKYIGQSEQKIRDVFERAQAAAPCVVFFDEFDAVAPQRGSDNAGVTDRVVNQLLCYLDGVEGRKDVYVVAASSRPDLIDAALLRPGRLDKAVQCGVPTHSDRVDIVRGQLARAGAATLAGDAALLHDVAARTEHWTPADLTAAVATASARASQRALRALTASRGGNGKDDDEDAGFAIAGVAAGVARDKVADALRRHVAKAGGSGAAAAARASATTASLLQMTRDDLDAALATTRPSLTARDLARAQRIHDLFARGATPTPAQPGTKVTFS